ncbi:MAG: hypothetical protein ACREQ2_18960 [Candidatus Binatia bacterium]
MAADARPTRYGGAFRSELLRGKLQQMTLCVLDANARGRRFYERQGFDLDSTRTKKPDRRHKLPELRYWRTLSR